MSRLYKVKITKSDTTTHWYHGRIGETFYTRYHADINMFVLIGRTLGISYGDCVIINLLQRGIRQIRKL